MGDRQFSRWQPTKIHFGFLGSPFPTIYFCFKQLRQKAFKKEVIVIAQIKGAYREPAAQR
jgi:hypothetical protein